LERLTILGRRAGRPRLNVCWTPGFGPSSGAGDPRRGLREVRVLGSRPAANPLHSVACFTCPLNLQLHERTKRFNDHRDTDQSRAVVPFDRPWTRSPRGNGIKMGRSAATLAPSPKAAKAQARPRTREGHRDTVEAVVVAFIGMLVARGFEAQ